MVFCFVQNFFFGQHKRQNIIFFVARNAIFFSEFNIMLYDKNSESDFFYSSTKIRIFFSATLGIRIFFQVKWSFPYNCPVTQNSMVLQVCCHFCLVGCCPPIVAGREGVPIAVQASGSKKCRSSATGEVYSILHYLMVRQ